MIAAIYCRKSNAQDVDDRDKSVARQTDEARAYAARKGWTVDDAHVFVDDGISGAEFAARPGFVRLMAALKPRAPFGVLVMSEVSRLGREQIETAYALKQLSQAGVRCFSYLDDREIALDSALDKFLLGVVTFAADLEREKARQRTFDALQRKAQHGFVAGGAPLFGYDNVPVFHRDGAKKSHVVRRINDPQAAVVRQLFDLAAAGLGFRRIAVTLNDAHALAPTPKQGRPCAWTPDTVKLALNNRTYIGVVTWGRTRKHDQWGQDNRTTRPASEHVTTELPELRIVTDEQWHAAHARIAIRVAKTKAIAAGRKPFRCRDGESPWLLNGFARCEHRGCGGSFYAISRGSGDERRGWYLCAMHHKRGKAVCANNLRKRVEIVDASVLHAIEAQVLRPRLWGESIERAWEFLQAQRGRDADDTTRDELAKVDRALKNLAQAIADAGGPIDALVAKLKAAQARRETLTATLAARRTYADFRYQPDAIERKVQKRMDDLRRLLNPTDGRDLLRAVLDGPMCFAPTDDGAYAFLGDTSIGGVLAGVIDDVAPFAIPRSGNPMRCTVSFSGIAA